MVAKETGTWAQRLEQIGAIQFGQFQQRDGSFAPFAVNLRLLPSYPSLLRDLAQELAPLMRFDGLTHLLAMPSVVPLGAAVSLAANLPLMYLAADDPKHIEGGYDFNVPTVMLTDLLIDGHAEQEMIRHAARLGLDVKAVVAVIDFGVSTLSADLPLHIWRPLPNLLNECGTPALRQVALDWIAQRSA